MTAVLAWDAAAARTAVDRIAAEVLAAYRPGLLWPVHPEDADDPIPGDAGLRCVYNGAAGVLLGLAMVGEVAPSLGREVYQAYLDFPILTEAPEPSYLIGESGVLLAAWRVSPSADLADRLYECVLANVERPECEYLWGAPGTLIVAAHMRRWTGEARWEQAMRASVEALWRAWEPDGLWTQDLYGKKRRFLGAAHGFAGNAGALLAAWELLPDQDAFVARCERALEQYEENGNWGRLDVPEPEQRERVQWCHGAPGIVTSFARLPVGRSARLERLLLAAGERTWQHGPLADDAGLCHGTAGNGYAFLALFARTGDPRWLERARAFAAAALAQYDARRAAGSPIWCSLLTGDVGLATYLWHCLQGHGAFPTDLPQEPTP